MKIETEIVTEFFNNLKYLVSQIGETVKSGDDGFALCVDEQIAEIIEAINGFIILNVAPTTPKAIVSLEYVRFFENYYGRNTIAAPDLEYTDNIKLYKGGLYTHIKKAIRELKTDDLAAIKNDELFNWIEAIAIIGSSYEKTIYTKEWYYSSQDVITDVANEIIEHRKKAPQQKLF